ncbi:MAG TPA: MCE family protein [Aeromicrobium sp.]|nr:MCE family protein [Aeromicrobium sp.]
MKKLVTPFRVGLLVIGAAAILFIFLTFVKKGGMEKDEGVTLFAYFRDASGLNQRSRVQIAGIGVGEVRGIELDGQRVKVDFTVDRDAQLGRSTTATVKIGTLLGNHYLDVAPAGGGSLPNDTIDLSHTSVSYNLQDVIEGSTETLEDLDGETVADSLTTIADALDYSPAQSRAAIDGIARLSQVAAAQSDKLHALLASSAEVSDLMADNSAELIDLMKRSTVVLEELTDRREVIHAMLKDSRELATQVAAVLKENAADLDPMMRDFTSATNNLRRHESELTAAIDSIATLSHYLANASGSGKYLDLHTASGLPDSLTCGVGC